MGTRNITMAKINGEYKLVQYGQWDGYPAEQGMTTLDFCRNSYRLNQLKEKLSRVVFMNNDQIEQFNKRLQDEKDIKVQRYFEEYLSRNLGAEILMNVARSDLDEIYLLNRYDFFLTGWCEWAYCINYDTSMLEVYKNNDHKIAEYPFDNLPDDETFLALDDIKRL